MSTHGVRLALQGWEDIEALQQHFPDAPDWGQAGLLEGGNVITNEEHMAGTTEHSTEDEYGTTPVGQRRLRRINKPNRNVRGPDGLVSNVCVCAWPGSYMLCPAKENTIKLLQTFYPLSVHPLA
jgi:hypothetical protein